MGYTAARDTLFLRADREDDGYVRGVYTDFAVYLEDDGSDPSTELYNNGIKNI